MMDDADYNMRKLRESLRESSKKEALAMMTLAGFTVEHMWELANGYWPDSPAYDDVRQPWWLMMTKSRLLVQVGRRKRVWNIDWEASSIRRIVTSDDVTKTETHVHAWSVEKAVEYLRNLREMSGSS